MIWSLLFRLTRYWTGPSTTPDDLSAEHGPATQVGSSARIGSATNVRPLRSVA
jgi:hypothetical protein